MDAMLEATDAQVAMLGELVSSIQAVESTLSSLQAVRDGLLATAGRLAGEIAEQDRSEDIELELRTVASEIGAALRVSDRAVQRRMSDAWWLVEAFPRVWMAQGHGLISAAHARAIVDAGAHLEDPAARDAYAREILPVALAESPNRVGRLARRIADRYQRRSPEDRRQDARKRRAVWIKDVGDGNSELGMRGPSALVHGIYDRLTEMAMAVDDENTREASTAARGGSPDGSGSRSDVAVSVAGTGASGAEGTGADSAATADQPDDGRFRHDSRSIDQLRADLLADILLTGSPSAHQTADGLLGAIQASIEVTVPVFTLIASERGQPVADALAALGWEGDMFPPPEVDGSCPIDIDTARRLAGAASGWDRVLTHPITGAVVAVDRYRPSERLRRKLKARDQRCRFPTCGMRARRCDDDHTIPASAGGETGEENLRELCRRHHVVKHHTPWHVTQLGGGLLRWQSPTGRVYIDRPPAPNTVRLPFDWSHPWAAAPPGDPPAPF